MRTWLVEKRKSAGISQQTVAKKSGISQAYYAEIESGRKGKPLKVPIAKAIAAVLGFDWTQFYDENTTNEKEAV